MKVTYHIPMEEKGFAIIETDSEELTYWEAKRNLNYQAGPGLDNKEFNKALDRYLTDNDMEAEAYEAMDAGQRDIIQTIKRALKRIKAKS